jgi:hypothetical protein
MANTSVVAAPHQAVAEPRSPAPRRVLLLDEGWAQTIDLATALEDAGHQVTVVTASGGTTSYRHRTVQWRSGPALASPALLPHLDHLMTAERYDHVLPLTEAAMTRLWDACPPWGHHIHPATAACSAACCATSMRCAGTWQRAA